MLTENKFGKYLIYAIGEIILVVIGILLALWINNWNENQKDERYIKQIYSSLNKELIETTDDLTYNITIHKSLVDTLEFYKKDDKISILDAVNKVNGIQIPTIKINSWKAISNSKIEIIEYNKVSALSNIEEQKEILKAKSQNLMNFIYPNTKETGLDNKELFKLMMLDIINTETTLKKQIELILTK